MVIFKNPTQQNLKNQCKLEHKWYSAHETNEWIINGMKRALYQNWRVFMCMDWCGNQTIFGRNYSRSNHIELIRLSLFYYLNGCVLRIIWLNVKYLTEYLSTHSGKFMFRFGKLWNKIRQKYAELHMSRNVSQLNRKHIDTTNRL